MSTQRKLPNTSIAANEYMEQSGKKTTHAQIILNCLKTGFKGNYEQIAMRCGLSPSQVEKRISEIPQIVSTGETKKTSSQREATVWQYHIDQPIPQTQGQLFE